MNNQVIPFLTLRTYLLCIILLSVCENPAHGTSLTEKQIPETGTALQWLERLDEMVTEEQKIIDREPALSDLAQGLQLYFQGSSWIRRIKKGAYGGGWNSEKQACLDRFTQWLKNEGINVFYKWTLGKPLTPHESKHLMLARQAAIIRVRYWDLIAYKEGEKLNKLNPQDKAMVNRYNSISELAKEVIHRLYSHQKVSREDLGILREYRMGFHAGYMPLNFGWSKREHALGHTIRGGRSFAVFKPGEKVPDFSLMTFEHALKSPSYSDVFPRHHAWIATSVIVKTYLSAAASYRIHTDEKTDTLYPEYLNVGKDKEGHISISSLNGKPTLFFIADSKDADSNRFAQVLEHLHRAYKDKINVAFITQATCPEVRHSGPTHYNYFKQGTPSELDKGHSLSMEEQARRVKFHYMTFPQLSYPTLLDDMGASAMNYFSAESRFEYYLLDKNGRFAWARCPWTAPFGYAHLLPGAHGTMDFVMVGRDAERAIIKLLQNDGLYDPEHESYFKFAEKYMKELNERKESAEKNGRELKMSSKVYVVKTDLQKRILRVQVDPGHVARRMRKGVPVEWDVQIDDDTEFRYLNFNGEIIKLSDLSPGDLFSRGFQFETTKESFGKTPGLLKFAVLRDGKSSTLPPRKHYGNMWTYGIIQQIDKDKNTLTVLSDQTNIETHLGYRFWKESLGKKGDGRSYMKDELRPNIELMDQWGGTESERTVCFTIDNTFVFLNGQEATCSILRPGDRVGICFNYKGNSAQRHYKAVSSIHATRLSKIEIP